MEDGRTQKLVLELGLFDPHHWLFVAAGPPLHAAWHLRPVYDLGPSAELPLSISETHRPQPKFDLVPNNPMFLVPSALYHRLYTYIVLPGQALTPHGDCLAHQRRDHSLQECGPTPALTVAGPTHPRFVLLGESGITQHRQRQCSWQRQPKPAVCRGRGPGHVPTRPRARYRRGPGP